MERWFMGISTSPEGRRDVWAAVVLMTGEVTAARIRDWDWLLTGGVSSAAVAIGRMSIASTRNTDMTICVFPIMIIPDF
jgi:hypothetical protein